MIREASIEALRGCLRIIAQRDAAVCPARPGATLSARCILFSFRFTTPRVGRARATKGVAAPPSGCDWRGAQVRRKWFSLVFQEAERGLHAHTTHATHGSLLTLGELLQLPSIIEQAPSLPQRVRSGHASSLPP